MNSLDKMEDYDRLKQERIQTEQRREAFREGKTAKIGTVVGAVRRKRVLPVLPELPKAGMKVERNVRPNDRR